MRLRSCSPWSAAATALFTEFLLIREIEENLGTQVIDIPIICKGSSESDSVLRGFHLKLSNQPNIVARMTRCDVNMPNFEGSQLKYKLPRPGSRWRYTSSCVRSLIFWLLACFTTVSQCSTLVPNLISLKTLRAVARSCLKEQKERMMYGTISPQGGRCVPMSVVSNSTDSLLSRHNFLLNQPVCASLFNV